MAGTTDKTDFVYQGPDWDQIFAGKPREFTAHEELWANSFRT